MLLTDLKHRVDQTLLLRQNKDLEVHVVVNAPGSIGGTPGVTITSAGHGIDWDKGKFMLRAAQPLTLMSAEDLEAVYKSVKAGQSYHAYQQWKKQQDLITTLRAQVESLGGTPKA